MTNDTLLILDMVAVRHADGVRERCILQISSPKIIQGAAPTCECLVSISGCDQWSFRAVGAHSLQAIESATLIAVTNLRSRQNVWRFEDDQGNELPFNY